MDGLAGNGAAEARVFLKSCFVYSLMESGQASASVKSNSAPDSPCIIQPLYLQAESLPYSNKPLENSDTVGKYFSSELGKATEVRKCDRLVILAQLPYTPRVYHRPEWQDHDARFSPQNCCFSMLMDRQSPCCWDGAARLKRRKMPVLGEKKGYVTQEGQFSGSCSSLY